MIAIQWKVTLQMKLRLYPDPILRTVATPVKAVTPELCAMGMEMMNFMKQNGGIGLAAQQVGLTERVIVIDTQKADPSYGTALIMFNPRIVDVDDDTFPFVEGCLSFPDQNVVTNRPFSVLVEWLDKNRSGYVNKKWFVGITAVCIQHEIQHLDGVLFIDNK